MAKRKKKHHKQPVQHHTFHIPKPDNLQGQTEPHPYKGIAQLFYQWILKHNPTVTRNSIHTQADQVMQEHSRLMNQYINQLATTGIYPNKTVIDQLDCIDMSAFGNPDQPCSAQKPKTEDFDITMEYLKHPENHPFYYLIPCFKTGFLKTNQQRGIYFNILQIDEEHQSIKLHIQDFMLTDLEPECGRSADITYRYEHNGVTCISENEQSFIDVYTKLSPKNLRWNNRQISFWEEITLQNAVNQDVLFQKIHKDPAKELANLFLCYLLLSNYYLSQKRPTIEKSKNKTANPKIKTKNEPTTNTEPIKRIRHIGNVRFISEKTPSKPTQEQIRTYRLANWGVRGHIRHYKNGKTVYIQPQTRHRKALEGHTNPKIQNVLYIHNQKGEKTHEK